MSTQNFTSCNGGDFVSEIIQQHKRNADKYGIFNGEDYPTIIRVFKSAGTYMLRLNDGNYPMSKDLYEHLMSEAIRLGVPVLSDI